MKKFFINIIIFSICFVNFISAVENQKAFAAKQRLAVTRNKTSMNNPEKMKKIKKLSKNFYVTNDEVENIIYYKTKKVLLGRTGFFERRAVDKIFLYPIIKVNKNDNTVSLIFQPEYYSEYTIESMSGRNFNLHDSGGSSKLFPFTKVSIRADEKLYAINFDLKDMSIRNGSYSSGFGLFYSSYSSVLWIKESYSIIMTPQTFAAFYKLTTAKNVIIRFLDEINGVYVDKKLTPNHLEAFTDTLELFRAIRD